MADIEQQRANARGERSTPPSVVGLEEYPGHFMILARRFDKVHDQFYSSPQWESVRSFFDTDDRHVLHPDILRRLEGLERGRALVQEAIAHPDSQATLARIKLHYETAYALTQGKSMEEQAAARLAEFGGKFTVITDCDGTMTDMASYRGETPIDPLLVGSEAVDLLEQEKPEHYLVFTAAVRDYFLKNHPDLLVEGAKMVPLRDGMPTLLTALQHQGIQINILSANSKPFVETIAQRSGLDLKRMGICAVSEHETHGAISFDKDLVIQLAAIADPEKAIIYFGDGGSDLKTLDAREQIGVYFALEGSSFANQLAEERKKDPRIVYFTYKTGDDIQQKLTEIQTTQLTPARRNPLESIASS